MRRCAQNGCNNQLCWQSRLKWKSRETVRTKLKQGNENPSKPYELLVQFGQNKIWRKKKNLCFIPNWAWAHQLFASQPKFWFPSYQNPNWLLGKLESLNQPLSKTWSQFIQTSNHGIHFLQATIRPNLSYFHQQSPALLLVKTMEPVNNLHPQLARSNVLFFPKRAEQNSTLIRTETSTLIRDLWRMSMTASLPHWPIYTGRGWGLAQRFLILWVRGSAICRKKLSTRKLWDMGSMHRSLPGTLGWITFLSRIWTRIRSLSWRAAVLMQYCVQSVCSIFNSLRRLVCASFCYINNWKPWF